LPVAVDIMAAKGCVGMIFELMQKLLAAGIIGAPKTGNVVLIEYDRKYEIRSTGV
jgi:hypothetical protein